MTDFLHGVEVVEIQSGQQPIRTVKSAVIGLVGTAPKGPLNEPTLIAGNPLDGAMQFGSQAAGVGTIPDALAAIFAQHGAAVVVVNVLDTATHVAAVAATTYTFDGDDRLTLPYRYALSLVIGSDGLLPGDTAYVETTDYTIVLSTGVITPVSGQGPDTDSTVFVEYTNAGTVYRENVDKSSGTYTPAHVTGGISDVSVYSEGAAAEYTEGTDYTHDPDTGVISRSVGGAIGAGQTVSIGYSRPDDTLVTATNVVGGVDANTDAYSGISALLGARSALGVTPKILSAPGYNVSAVADALISVADRLRAVALIEGPSTTDSDAQSYRGNFGSRRAYLVDPDVLVEEGGAQVSAPNSAYVAGVIARSDAERGFWWSPSNREIRGIVGTARPIDFALGDPNARANLLNENEIATIIREKGYRLWGNRTCSAAPKWAFLSVVRTADILNDSLLRSHLWAVDRNISRTYFDDVAEGVNAYISELVGRGALLGGRCYPSPNLNTASSLADGRVYFDIAFTPPPPAERVTFRSRLTNDYLETIFESEDTEEEASA